MRPWVLLLLLGCGERVTRPAATAVPQPKAVFSLPLAEPERFYQTVGVDHDPVDNGGTIAADAVCEDYEGRGFPWCYDEHLGSDYLLEDGWDAMDAGSTNVVAAAAGVVVATDDGHYDRCHLSFEVGGIDCDGFEMRPNFVVIDHGDGLEAGYYHLATGSVAVEVGDRVACGDVLGRVGSSGNSSFPHLHLEVELNGRTIDPYAGPNNPIDSLWIEQNGPTQLPAVACP